MTNLVVQGYTFPVPPAVIDGITVGYVLQEEGEVHALRQTKLENLRNNFASKVKVALGEADQLTDAQLADLQAQFTEYANGYKFGVRSGGGAPRVKVDPVTKKMLDLAKSDIKVRYKAKHGENIEKDALAELAGQLIEKRRDDYLKRANAILRQEQANKDLSLEEIGL